MVSSAIAGLLLGRLSSWFIAKVIRSTLSWASAALVLYFVLIGLKGAIVGRFDWDFGSRAFTACFFIAFVLSPKVVREATRHIAGLRCEVSFGSLLLGPTALLLVILFGLLLAHLSSLHA